MITDSLIASLYSMAGLFLVMGVIALCLAALNFLGGGKKEG